MAASGAYCDAFCVRGLWIRAVCSALDAFHGSRSRYYVSGKQGCAGAVPGWTLSGIFVNGSGGSNESRSMDSGPTVWFTQTPDRHSETARNVSLLVARRPGNRVPARRVRYLHYSLGGWCGAERGHDRFVGGVGSRWEVAAGQGPRGRWAVCNLSNYAGWPGAPASYPSKVRRWRLAIRSFTGWFAAGVLAGRSRHGRPLRRLDGWWRASTGHELESGAR